MELLMANIIHGGKNTAFFSFVITSGAATIEPGAIFKIYF